ncbi:Tetratricopeptide repeat-containing protein [Mariprofundus aestuarium]|uniref:Tetratricopeptide repeat-containing protein n=1 Tax=Mariprofundus aestuarium TaxID=1921086 RepID=A0A2K8KXQ3_MARES|nr:tetratricopeptide repeat protein [Mariprofundus aestuarium]ATX79735.1 Tetratricopeptide repeat-containing protein [Mariprofundus aestuarium]
MKKILNLMALFFGMLFIVQSVAYADSCSSVEREMVQGQTAVEVARNDGGFQKAARLFEKATEKAPGCADAYYNLGLVYEKTTDYAKAKKALEKYLRLSPDAKDAATVRKQIYRLEFLVSNKVEEQKALKTAEGRFVDNGDGTISDIQTGLMWAKKDSYAATGTCIWMDAAQTYARDLITGGHQDWRPPSIKELQSIYDDSEGIHAMDFNGSPLHLPAVFEQGGGYRYWSSEFSGDCCASFLDFRSNTVGRLARSFCDGFGVRAVRP